MDVGSVLSQGLSGLQRSQSEINRSAQQIAQAGTSERNNPAKNDVTEALVNFKAETQVFNSSAKVVKAADEAVGTLLNTRA